MKTTTKYLLANSLLAILGISIFALYSLNRFHAEEVKEENENLEKCMRTFWELFRHKGKEFRIVDGRLLADNYLVNGNFEVPDKVQAIFGGVATVFMGDTRVSTNVLKSDGNRAVGTKLKGPAFDALFSKGKAYRDETLILDIPYLTAYEPIRDSKGKIIGAMFVGVKKSEFLAHFNSLKVQLFITLCGLFAFLATIMFVLGRATKKTEKMKENHLFFLRKLIDTIPSPIFYKNAAGQYLGVNRAFESFVGISREEIIGKKVHELWTKEQADIYQQKDMALFENPGEQNYESSVKYADGTLHDVVFYKATFNGKDGGLGGLVGAMLDITERKAATEEIRNAYQRMFDIIEFLPDATFVLDKEQRVIAWNKAIEKMTGVRKEEILGQGDYAYAIPFYGVRRPILIDHLGKDQDDFKHSYNSNDKVGSTLSVETKISSFRNGADRFFWSTASFLFDKHGKRVGAIQSVRDITERKRNEEEKSRLEAQLYHSQIMGAIMIQLGHDLKTPLTPLLALLPLLRDRASDPESKRVADICCNSACHIGMLSDKALRFAKLSSATATIKRDNIGLASSVDESIRDSGSLVAGNNISFENLIGPEIIIQAVSEQIRELFANLISNAVRYSMCNGVIRIVAEQGEENVTVSVQDYGIGISPEHLENIFNEFFKTDESRHDLASLGLGLSICKRIVLNHEGRIWAESSGIGQGTKIMFTLPLFAV